MAPGFFYQHYYLTNFDELAHYSVIIGYCYNWETKPAILDVGCGDGILLEKLTEDIEDGYIYKRFIDDIYFTISHI